LRRSTPLELTLLLDQNLLRVFGFLGETPGGGAPFRRVPPRSQPGEGVREHLRCRRRLARLSVATGELEQEGSLRFGEARREIGHVHRAAGPAGRHDRDEHRPMQRVEQQGLGLARAQLSDEPGVVEQDRTDAPYEAELARSRRQGLRGLGLGALAPRLAHARVHVAGVHRHGQRQPA
jgi:hypothetical protein